MLYLKLISQTIKETIFFLYFDKTNAFNVIITLTLETSGCCCFLGRFFSTALSSERRGYIHWLTRSAARLRALSATHPVSCCWGQELNLDNVVPYYLITKSPLTDKTINLFECMTFWVMVISCTWFRQKHSSNTVI